MRATHVQFPLHPDTPPGGIALAELFAGRGLDLEVMHARMKSLMDAEGLPYARRERTYNSRLAQELGKWGEAADKPAIHDALYRAYFVDGTDIDSVDALVELAERVGLPADEARRVLSERSFRAAVDRDWAHARALGVTGVPTFVAAGRAVVGAQPYEALERLVQAAGAERR
ncbi:MAG: oxidoreductase [bacterium]|nr:oxidoreductase [bacterium]